MSWVCARVMITILIHSGSRGLGYQVCDDYLGVFKGAPKRYGFTLPDPQLACAPVRSPEGQSLPGCHASGGELRLVQPPAPDPPGARGLRAGL